MCMGIHYKYPTPRTHTIAYLTAYANVIIYLALGSLLCRFMLANAVSSSSGNSNGSCAKVVYVKVMALHA